MSSSSAAPADPAPDSPGDKREVTRRDWVSLWAVLLVQAQNAFNDNFVKIILIALAVIVAEGTKIGTNIERILSSLIPIPFILLAPIAGYFSDRFSKKQVIFLCLVGQLSIFIFIGVSVMLKSIPMAVFGFFLLAVQSTMFSPAKQGILKELVGSEKLGFANGFLQMLTMVGILAGMWLGGKWFDQLLAGYNAESGVSTDNAWRAGMIPIFAIGAGSLVPLALSFLIEKTPDHPKTKFRKSIWWSHFVELGYLFSHRQIRIVALLIGFYWLVVNFLAFVIFTYARELNAKVSEGGLAGDSADMLALIGVGLILGSFTVSFLSKNKIRLGLVPIGAIAMALSLLGMGLIARGSMVFDLNLGWMGYAGAADDGILAIDLWQLTFCATGFWSAFFLVPLAATLQDLPEEQHRGRVLAAANLLTSFSGIVAIGLSQLLASLKISASTQSLVFVLPLALAAIYVSRLPKILHRQVR